MLAQRSKLLYWEILLSPSVAFSVYTLIPPLTRDEAVLHANVWLFKNLRNTCEGNALTFRTWRTIFPLFWLRIPGCRFMECTTRQLPAGASNCQWCWFADRNVCNIHGGIHPLSWVFIPFACVIVVNPTSLACDNTISPVANGRKWPRGWS